MGIAEYLSDENSEISQIIKRKARQLICKPYFDYGDKEDLEQSLSLRAIQAYAKFDSKRGRLVAFIQRVINNESRNLIAAQMTIKSKNRRGALSWEDAFLPQDGNRPPKKIDSSTYFNMTGRGPSFDEQEIDRRADLDNFIRRLPEDMKSLCESLEVHTQSTIAELQKTARSTVHRKVLLVRRRAEEEGLRDYLE